MNQDLKKYQNLLNGMNAVDSLQWALQEFGVENLVVASSLGAEDQVLTEMALSANDKSRIFTLDTGRWFQETYDVMQATMQKYNMTYEVMFPNQAAVQDMEAAKGPNLFYDSIENRKQCCGVRKIEPLKRALGTAKIWVTGLRAEQSVTRTDLDVLQWDEAFGLWKLNPLASWTEKDVWDYIQEKEIPFNALHEQGFPSIGCAPCTRAVEPGTDIRSGRWWWETPEQKECGLHVKDGKLVRKNA